LGVPADQYIFYPPGIYYRCPYYRSSRTQWVGLDVPKPFPLLGFILLSIGCGRVRDGCVGSSIRHLRHVAGRAARGRPEANGQLPAGSTLAFHRSDSGGKSIRQAAGHRQVADKMRQRVDAAGRHGKLLERRRGELQGA
jgi:hypothetical protein